MLVRVLYVSLIEPTMTPADITQLVAYARRRNRQLDLTGALLVCDGHFAQALEGSEIAVEEMMRKIALDPRHRDLRIRQRLAITRRLFADWDMAFIDDSRCEADVHDLLENRTTNERFLDAMAVWMAESKSAPY